LPLEVSSRFSFHDKLTIIIITKISKIYHLTKDIESNERGKKKREKRKYQAIQWYDMQTQK
jgi:hypothetical protein